MDVDMNAGGKRRTRRGCVAHLTSHAKIPSHNPLVMREVTLSNEHVHDYNPDINDAVDIR